MKKSLCLLLILFSLQKDLSAQINADSAVVKNNYVKIYLDGVSGYEDYIKTEITFVDYVRDRFEADVHVLITTQTTGSGGDEYTLFFLGQKSFRGKNDTLKY